MAEMKSARRAIERVHTVLQAAKRGLERADVKSPHLIEVSMSRGDVEALELVLAHAIDGVTKIEAGAFEEERTG